jgi:hypothetical protein
MEQLRREATFKGIQYAYLALKENQEDLDISGVCWNQHKGYKNISLSLVFFVLNFQCEVR